MLTNDDIINWINDKYSGFELDLNKYLDEVGKIDKLDGESIRKRIEEIRNATELIRARISLLLALRDLVNLTK